MKQLIVARYDINPEYWERLVVTQHIPKNIAELNIIKKPYTYKGTYINLRGEIVTDKTYLYSLSNDLHNWLVENNIEYKLIYKTITSACKDGMPIRINPSIEEIYIELEDDAALLFKLACL